MPKGIGFDFEFFGFNQDNIYTVLNRLTELSQGNGMLAAYIKDHFSDALSMKSVIDKMIYYPTYPIQWDRIIEDYPNYYWLAIDESNLCYLYKHRPLWHSGRRYWHPSAFYNNEENEYICIGIKQGTWPDVPASELIFERPA